MPISKKIQARNEAEVERAYGLIVGSLAVAMWIAVIVAIVIQIKRGF